MKSLINSLKISILTCTALLSFFFAGCVNFSSNQVQLVIDEGIAFAQPAKLSRPGCTNVPRPDVPIKFVNPTQITQKAKIPITTIKDVKTPEFILDLSFKEAIKVQKNTPDGRAPLKIDSSVFWLEMHNQGLLEIIKSLAGDDADALKLYLETEGNGTVEAQIEKRTNFIILVVKELKK